MFRLPLAFIIVLATSTGAMAAESVYSSLDLNDRTYCRRVSAPSDPEDGGLWRCRGAVGIDVFVADSDARMAVWTGRRDLIESPHDWLGPLNSTATRIEWRLIDGRPVATILRYFTRPMLEDGSSGRGQVLVVAKVEPGRTCHVAYIDGMTNADANLLARDAADRLTLGFRCGDEPRRLGRPGLSLPR